MNDLILAAHPKLLALRAFAGTLATLESYAGDADPYLTLSFTFDTHPSWVRVSDLLDILIDERDQDVVGKATAWAPFTGAAAFVAGARAALAAGRVHDIERWTSMTTYAARSGRNDHDAATDRHLDFDVFSQAFDQLLALVLAPPSKDAGADTPTSNVNQGSREHRVDRSEPVWAPSAMELLLASTHIEIETVSMTYVPGEPIAVTLFSCALRSHDIDIDATTARNLLAATSSR